MKKLIITVFVVVMATGSYSQTTVKDLPVSKINYLQKSKKQKTAAWILLGGGVGLTVFGLSQINLAGSDHAVNNTPGTILLVTGLAASITSIPFFVASQKNKRKAMSLSFNNEMTKQLCKNSYVNKCIPSLRLSVGL